MDAKSLYLFVMISMLLCTVGCSVSSEPESTMQVEVSTQETSVPVFEQRSGSEIPQWAAEASASSEFTNDEWAAEDATGPPDTDRCGDYQTAWASAASDGVSTLVLTYTQSVIPIMINIHQSFNPDQVTEIFVVGDDSNRIVYQNDPQQIDQPCPYILSVPITDVGFPVRRLEITVDQSQLGLGWNEIDAVELIGTID